MGGRANLIPFNERTKEEQREIATMGGYASGRVRQEKKRLRELLEIALELEDDKGEKNSEVIISSLIKEAKKGNVKAFETIRDTIGEKPSNDISITGKTIFNIGFNDED